MNDLVFEYQHNRAVTAKEEDEIDTRPDEQMQNVQNKVSSYFVGCILRYIRAGAYGILRDPKKTPRAYRNTILFFL